MRQAWDLLELLIDRGGPVMYPLLAVSVLSLALIIERTWFWLGVHNSRSLNRLARVSAFLRAGDRSSASRLLKDRGNPYDRLAAELLKNGSSDSVALEAAHQQQPRFERFMVSLSTIITAAPLLGILGTVLGIIQSFQLLGDQSALNDPRDIASGIAQALLTTAMGLVVALFTLFPYMIFRSHVDRATARLESLIAAAQHNGSSISALPADGSKAHDTVAATEAAFSRPRTAVLTSTVEKGAGSAQATH